MARAGAPGHDPAIPLPADLDQLDAETLRRLLIEQERELGWRQTKIERLTHELALHKRHRFGVKAERLSSEQAQLFEETAEADLAARAKSSSSSSPTPASFRRPRARRGASHCRPSCRAPRSVTSPTRPPAPAAAKCIGEDIAEKLDYTPGRFTVEHLQPLVDALKRELLAHPVLHADETPVAMLDPGAGQTHRAYLWSYSVGAFDPIKAVVYDFADSRAGRHAQALLGDWRGTLICHYYAGYKALIAQGVKEAGCTAHARREFFDLNAQGQSQIASEALEAIGQLYGIEREAVELDIDARQRLREVQARPILERLHTWLPQRRTQVHSGSAIALAIDYSLKRWAALTH